MITVLATTIGVELHCTVCGWRHTYPEPLPLAQVVDGGHDHERGHTATPGLELAWYCAAGVEVVSIARAIHRGGERCEHYGWHQARRAEPNTRPPVCRCAREPRVGPHVVGDPGCVFAPEPGACPREVQNPPHPVTPGCDETCNTV